MERTTASSPRLGWTEQGIVGFIFLPLGVIFLPLGLLLSRSGQVEPEDQPVFLYVFGGLGALFLLTALILLALDLRRRSRQRRAWEDGMCVRAKVAGIRTINRVSISGTHPVQAECHWTDPDTGIVHVYFSRYLYVSVGDLLDGREVPVCVSRDDPAVMERHHLQELTETVNEMRCPEDFDTRVSNQKTDFYRAWYHTRSPHAECSLEAERAKRLQQEESDESNHSDSFIHQPFIAGFSDRSSEDAIIARLDQERFQASLSPTDRQILRLRMEGRTLEEIANLTGYETHSAVQKRMKKIRDAYREYNQITD